MKPITKENWIALAESNPANLALVSKKKKLEKLLNKSVTEVIDCNGEVRFGRYSRKTGYGGHDKGYDMHDYTK